MFLKILFNLFILFDKIWNFCKLYQQKNIYREDNEMFRRKKEIFYVRKVKIIINESTLDVFRNTIYYVDMQDALCIKGVPFITCDIYEDEFSDHLIAQVGLEDDEENDILPSAEELKNKKIVCFIQLDEHIMR